MKATFFDTPEAFRSWLLKYHLSKKELLVGFYKIATKKASITWSESVDQALCFGWIDGIRRRIDEESYSIRFTPRKANSHWSDVNIKKMKELKAKGLLYPAGIAAFKKLNPNNARKASHEQKKVELSSAYLKNLRSNKSAWAYYQAMPPGYKKTTNHWVMSAKQEATRLRRLGILIESCAQGLKVPPLRRK